MFFEIGLPRLTDYFGMLFSEYVIDNIFHFGNYPDFSRDILNRLNIVGLVSKMFIVNILGMSEILLQGVPK